MSNKYTNRLLKKGEERKRLTDQLVKLVGEVTTELLNAMPDGQLVYIPDVGTYKAVSYKTHLGTFRFLAVNETADGQGTTWPIFYPKVKPAETVYIGDGPIRTASRESYLAFANNITTIINTFEEQEEAIIKALSNAFAELRKVAKIK